ncbi:hypothetical protein FACS1894111_02420 [Clostridia bacterium]|nr:hypothetical protein FACS1894111_02420 [Clostridia bacterium]
MARFSYKMQSILNIKYKLETQAKTAFGIAQAALSAQEDKLLAVQERQERYEQKAKELMCGHLDFPEIKFSRQAVLAIKEVVKEQVLAVHLAQRNVEAARQKLNEVMTERKTHEILREKAFDEFKKEVEAEESKAIDELVSYKGAEKKKEGAA